VPDDKPNAKPSFWTSLPGILTAATGLIAALSGLVGLIYRIPNPLADTPEMQTEKSLLAHLDTLRRSNPCPQNSFDAYVIDFSGLMDITHEYILYIQQTPTGDKKDRVLNDLRSTLAVIQMRNQDGTKYYDASDFHSHRLPAEFSTILDKIKASKQAGNDAARIGAVEAAMAKWFADSGFPSSAVDRLACRPPQGAK
jgi:hypothetical protein